MQITKPNHADVRSYWKRSKFVRRADALVLDTMFRVSRLAAADVGGPVHYRLGSIITLYASGREGMVHDRIFGTKKRG
jgi:hypothetical protein